MDRFDAYATGDATLSVLARLGLSLVDRLGLWIVE